jgi:hypothetical protein
MRAQRLVKLLDVDAGKCSLDHVFGIGENVDQDDVARIIQAGCTGEVAAFANAT